MSPPGASDDDPAAGPAGPATQRLDKWLWFARVIKSRTQAAGLVTGGSVRINREKAVKPSQTVRPGDVLTITVGDRLRILKVAAPGQRRGPAPEAQTLYEDLTPPPPPRDDPVASGAEHREPGSGRPTKRDRRLLDRLKGGEE